MELKGKDLTGRIVEVQPTKEFQIEEQDNYTYLSYITPKGDTMKQTIRSRGRERYPELAKTIWTKIIKDKYTLLQSSHLIYLEPTEYWYIAKKLKYGKNYLTGSYSVKLCINDERYHFPTPQEYYSMTHDISKNVLGVYGIKYNNELLYIGSSTNIEERWRQHQRNFEEKSNIKEMYQLELNTNELEYFTIFTAEELEGYSKEIPPTWLFEIIEWICIRIFNPKYNVAGKTLPFTFKDKVTYANLELPRNYQDICKDLLLGEISEKDKEAIEALKENKVEEITDIGLE